MVAVDQLHRPADPDQQRAAPLEVAKHPVVMALALAEPRAGAVNRHQRHQHQVGKHLGRGQRRLERGERTGLDRIAGEEAERQMRRGESGKATVAASAARRAGG